MPDHPACHCCDDTGRIWGLACPKCELGMKEMPPPEVEKLIEAIDDGTVPVAAKGERAKALPVAWPSVPNYSLPKRLAMTSCDRCIAEHNRGRQDWTITVSVKDPSRQASVEMSLCFYCYHEAVEELNRLLKGRGCSDI